MDKYITQLENAGLANLIPCLMQMDNQYYANWQVREIVRFWIEIGGANG